MQYFARGRITGPHDIFCRKSKFEVTSIRSFVTKRSFNVFPIYPVDTHTHTHSRLIDDDDHITILRDRNALPACDRPRIGISTVVNYRPTATNYDKLPTAGGKYVTLTAKWHK